MVLSSYRYLLRHYYKERVERGGWFCGTAAGSGFCYSKCRLAVQCKQSITHTGLLIGAGDIGRHPQSFPANPAHLITVMTCNMRYELRIIP